MRLFVGIDIPEDITTKLGALITELRPAAKLRWSPPANFHITTKFIGEWPDERLDEMKAALAAVSAPVFPITVRGLGWFPNPHHPRIFWAATKAGPELPALASATETAVATLGIEKEKRAYSPHLTLARIDEPVDLSELRRRIAARPGSDEFGEFQTTAFHLYLSRPGPRGSEYTKLATYALQAQVR
ncbi:MAG: RNA 2',3'-cyclic phosphodiesterase [Bryobacterales bacterium]|nr:RNA 2',3'-cyclic phosphodiesterase [Bryobacterales bacterium]